MKILRNLCDFNILLIIYIMMVYVWGFERFFWIFIFFFLKVIGFKMEDFVMCFF